MTVSEQHQLEPCVALHFNEKGVELTVAVQLQQGAVNWTPKEAGAWFARNWQEAQQALWVTLVHRSVNDPDARLVRHGEEPWSIDKITETVPALEMPVELPLSGVTVQPVAPEGPVRLPELTRVPEADLTDAEEKVTGSEAADAQQQVLQVLTQNGRAVSTADLKRMTGMSDYRVRRALRELVTSGTITEEMREAGAGRWKEIAFYGVKES